MTDTPKKRKPRTKRKNPAWGTLLGAMQQLFPDGYLDHEGYKRLGILPEVLVTKCTDFSQPPCRAADLFALVGVLLMKSGGYHRITPHVDGASSAKMVEITLAEREDWVCAGREWAGEGKLQLPPPPKALIDQWNALIQYQSYLLCGPPGAGTGPRIWWKHAAALLAMADEAAANLGFETGETKTAQAAVAEWLMRARIDAGFKVFTVSTANPDQVCILPKSRTPRVGCTLRSLSHHLALLPPRGMARAVWSPHPYGDPTAREKPVAAPFNVLIVPMPFKIKASAFQGIPSKEGTWGWFHVEPHWCPRSDEVKAIDEGFPSFWRFIEDLLDTAAKDVGTVHGMIFPEAALSHRVLRLLCEELKKRRGFELLVTGLFDTIDHEELVRQGNFAAMARSRRNQNGKVDFDISTREKHHRWRVEKSQIEAYSLGSALDSNRGWWEKLDILDRSLDLFVIRGGATVTTLICEDLARSEPCQDLVRGIGPNLVIALLMDGPQLKDRWPARYATVLAEDPGSSVLTVTSLGLIDRTNKSGQYPPSDKIGLWRDDSGRTVELSLGKGAQSLLLTLQPSELTEHTLDGRHDNGGAQSWRLTGMVPVSCENPQLEILEGNWPG